MLGSSVRLARFALVLCCLAVAAGCHHRPRIVTGAPMADGTMPAFTPGPSSLVVASTYDATALREAIARALTARGYELESESGQHMVARMSARRITLTIAIDYSPGSVVVSYVDSTGVPIEDGVSSRRYDGWMRELRETITSEVERPERERQEAVAHAEEAQHQREREAREERERSEQRARDERLEHERLAASRAGAEADAARARAAQADADARRAQAQAQPRIEGSEHVVSGRLRFDAEEARGVSGAIAVGAGRGPDPMTVTGTAGGTISRARLGFPDACPGFFEGSEQHTLVLANDVPYLRIEAPSDGDTTMAVVGPDGGVWCDDDGAGQLTPRIAGWWPAGVYRVYVGNYQRGALARYTLVITQRAPEAEPAYAQPRAQIVETEQCTNLLAMEWLAVAAGTSGSADYQTMTARQQVACSGVEAGSTEYWPNGVTFRSGSSWYYPSGVSALSGSSWYYPSGVTAISGSALYYPSGVAAQSGSQFYGPDGVASSESGLLTFASQHLSRARWDELNGHYRGATTTFWRSMYLLVMVSEASR